MSLSAALVLAAASVSTPGDSLPRGAVLAEARVTAKILPAAIVRQAGGPERVGGDAPHPQLTRRGNTVLVEFQ
jgi:hypothetical protein